MSEKREAFVTLATNDSYAVGAFVLGNSLRNVKTTRELVVLITDEVTHHYRYRLRHVFDIVKLVDPFDSGDEKHLRLLGRPDLGITLTKLHCWRLTEFSKAVFLDADTLVIGNIDDLFTRPELSAAPDVGWPDCFNSGVFVYKPSMQTYQTIVAFALQFGSFDGGDQGLLNEFFNTWATSDINTHLPFTYNMTATSAYWYAPALNRFSKDIKVVHFIGALKPWHHLYNKDTGHLDLNEKFQEGQQPFLTNYVQRWWEIYTASVNKLPSEVSMQSPVVLLKYDFNLLYVRYLLLIVF
ncbi:uncharacterized protein TRIADDRAFT_30669 [Trichoplax adhaerens]|uniref:glycogenin glucosyltransferase n=1 Tax=Trichoplax adhaerens TaxID=10228 RepID=B3S7L1_TRIAD|nr:hypothetical protein TRIADDRAFT_30669 [Trichoplax adhaerens]EDV21216.1 hypothetical protein TRIADDRAFT_30669 [Trichoplax adhaerens]|eukprot:XP_002116183.1 hypothetical protein TRIADDRAFT_30669 [Trichoplax adhaerens]